MRMGGVRRIVNARIGFTNTIHSLEIPLPIGIDLLATKQTKWRDTLKQSSWVQKWMRRIAHELGWQKSFQRLARYLGFYGTLDSEKASRADKLKIIELQNALAERPIIYIYTDRH